MFSLLVEVRRAKMLGLETVDRVPAVVVLVAIRRELFI
jgi:hypothetical protein